MGSGALPITRLGNSSPAARPRRGLKDLIEPAIVAEAAALGGFERRGRDIAELRDRDKAARRLAVEPSIPALGTKATLKRRERRFHIGTLDLIADAGEIGDRPRPLDNPHAATAAPAQFRCRLGPQPNPRAR